MNPKLILCVIWFIIGLAMFFLSNQIVRWQGPSNLQKGHYSIEERVKRLKIGGICFLFLGLYALIDIISN